MADAAPLCSSVSLAAAEPLYGTASRVRGWVLLEQPGPWGREALLESRLEPAVGLALRSRARAARVRLLLIRRPGRSVAGPRRCFVAHTGRRVRWVEDRWLNDPAELLELDFDAVRAGEPPGLGGRFHDPLFLVCTNGRHDRCCATYGRPLAAALAAGRPDQVWECSHIGGDRFAGNLVCLPHGLYLGRVGAADGPAAAAAYERGLVDLDHFRGRSCDAPAVQAAEWFARRRLGLDRLDDLALAGVAGGPGGVALVAFDAGRRGRVRVRVRVAPAATPRPLTCTSPPRTPPTFTLVDLESEPAA